MAVYSDEAIVLRTYKLGEADRIIVFFMRGRGKVRAVAKGVRRTKSKFGSRLEPASVVKAQLYEGKNLDTITQVERLDVFSNLRADIENFSRASMLLETVNKFTTDANSNPEMYRLTLKALRELDNSSSLLVMPAFVLKCLALEGVQPMVESCVQCSSQENLVSFYLVDGGVFCGSCRRGQSISQAALEALRLVLDGKVRTVIENTPDDVAFQLEALAIQMVEQHTEQKLLSPEALKGKF